MHSPLLTEPTVIRMTKMATQNATTIGIIITQHVPITVPSRGSKHTQNQELNAIVGGDRGINTMYTSVIHTVRVTL